MIDRQLKIDTIEECAQVVEYYLSFYSEDLFPAPPLGQHGETVDRCSARALRAVLPNIIKSIRALKR